MQTSEIVNCIDVKSELSNILKTFVKEIEGKFEEYLQELERSLDFTVIEKSLNDILNSFSAALLKLLLDITLKSKEFLALLKNIGGRYGRRYVRYREITIRLYNGQSIKLLSPYFAKAKPKNGRKRRKKGPQGKNGEGHIGLGVLGFVGLCSGNFVSEVVKLAVLCPSIKVAKEVLSERGISIDTKTISRLCQCLGQIGLEFRGAISLDGTEELDGYTLVIGVDGGRLRERETKRGKKKKGQKRQGFHAEWREPKLFTIYLMDNEGNIVKDFYPLHDATMEKKDGVFNLLENYLNSLDISNVSRVVFCGDGDPGIWNGVETICKKIGFNNNRIHQVLDYTHAKQNLNEIIDLIPEKTLMNKDKIAQKWKELLWAGDIDGLHQSISLVLSGKQKKSGIKKWRNYFQKNRKRMQYQNFKDSNIPCGSGCVESAIRRVINLRLKSPGIFWKKDMAELFLFLRSQLISGRWLIFMRNAVRRLVKNIKIEEGKKIIEFQMMESKAI